MDANTGWIITNKEIYKTTDGGDSWILQHYPPDVEGLNRQLHSVNFLNAQQGIITSVTYGSGGAEDEFMSNLLITKDGGETWENSNIGGSSSYSHAFWASEQVAYASGSYNTLIKTEDGGETWQGLQLEENLSGIRIHAVNEDTVVVVGLDNFSLSGNLAVTFDGGESWEFRGVYGIARAVFGIENHIWLATNRGKIYKSTDAGANWDDDWDGISSIGREVKDLYFIDQSNGWAVGPEGIIYKTEDGAESWEMELCDGVSNIRSIDYPIGSKGFALSYDGILFSQSIINFVESPITEKPPITAAPNPFHNFTSLQWQPVQPKVQCQIFDAYGRLVKTIGGENTDQLQISRKGLKAGLYFYRLIGELTPKTRGKELLGSGKLILVD